MSYNASPKIEAQSEQKRDEVWMRRRDAETQRQKGEEEDTEGAAG